MLLIRSKLIKLIYGYVTSKNVEMWPSHKTVLALDYDLETTRLYPLTNLKGTVNTLLHKKPKTFLRFSYVSANSNAIVAERYEIMLEHALVIS